VTTTLSAYIEISLNLSQSVEDVCKGLFVVLELPLTEQSKSTLYRGDRISRHRMTVFSEPPINRVDVAFPYYQLMSCRNHTVLG